MVSRELGETETAIGEVSGTQAITTDKRSDLFMFTRTEIPISAFVV